MTDNSDWQGRFLRYLEAWSWPRLLRELNAQDVLVADADILAAFESGFGKVRCQTLTPDKAAAGLPKGVSRVFVMTIRSELILVKKIRRQYPELEVLSCTYDVAPRSLFGAPDLQRAPAPDVKPARGPVILISSPYSDAEYLAKIMADNGLGKPREYLDHTLATWIERHEGFQLSRFLHTVESLYRDEGIIDLHIQTDVLQALLKHSKASWARFTKWVRQMDAKLVYFTRRDKLSQAVVGCALERTPHRSVWRMTDAQRSGLKAGDSFQFEDYNSWLQQVMISETVLEQYLAKEVKDFRMVTLEELIVSPGESLRELTRYLGRDHSNGFKMLPYQLAYQDLSHFHEKAAGFREEMIRHLGLSTNVHGSLVTITDQIFEGGDRSVKSAKSS